MKDLIPNIMSSERVRRVFHFIIVKEYYHIVFPRSHTFSTKLSHGIRAFVTNWLASPKTLAVSSVRPSEKGDQYWFMSVILDGINSPQKW